MCLQDARAHHRRERQRDDGGDQDGDGEGDGELAEEPADDVAHEEQRDQHGDQRDGERKMVKPICSLPLSAARIGRLAFFDVARDVLDHHDGVVDHEAGGDGERHQREVVERVAEQVHHAEGADDGERHGDAKG